MAALVQPDIAGQSQLRERGLQLAEPVKVSPAEAWVVGDEAALAAAPRDPQTGKIGLTTERINAAEFAEPTVKSVFHCRAPGIAARETADGGRRGEPRHPGTRDNGHGAGHSGELQAALRPRAGRWT